MDDLGSLRVGWCLDASGSDRGDHVQGGDSGDAAASVVEADLEVSGGLFDVEEQQVPSLGHERPVGVGDGDGLVGSNVFAADAGGVGLGVLAFGASDWSLLAVDGEMQQLERFGLGGVDAAVGVDVPGGDGVSFGGELVVLVPVAEADELPLGVSRRGRVLPADGDTEVLGSAMRGSAVGASPTCR